MIRHWNRFWFESDGGLRMRCFRCALGLLLFLFYLVRTLDLEFLFGDSGIAPWPAYKDLLSAPYRYSLLDYFHGNFSLWLLNGIFLLALLTLALGILPRISAVLSLILHVSFLHRNMAVVFGVDLISVFFLLYFCLADFRNRPASDPPDFRSMMGSMAYRLCQIQVCVIYAYSGMDKLRGNHWWRGDAIWDVLANAQLARWNFGWVAGVPLVLSVFNYATLLFEIYFPVLIWVRQVRYPILIIGVFIHLGIALTINIPFFGVMMIFTYLLFVEDAVLLKALGYLGHSMNQTKVRAAISDQSFV